MANYLNASTGRPVGSNNRGTKKKNELIHVDGKYLTTISAADSSYNNEDNVFNFEGYVPEDFNIDIESNWEPFGGLSALPGFDKLDTFSKLGRGGTLANKFLSPQLWGGPSYLSLTLPFELQSWSDSRKDVLNPLVNMLSLISPGISNASGILDVPGPVPLKQAFKSITAYTLKNKEGAPPPEAVELGGRIYTCTVGTFFKMTPCIITSVSTAFDSQFDDTNGLPISAVMNVQLQSYYPVTVEDIRTWFQVDKGN
jgi:hypothetical protein